MDQDIYCIMYIKEIRHQLDFGWKFGVFSDVSGKDIPKKNSFLND